MNDKIDTKIIGNITELEVQAYMTKLNIQVSIPYGDRARYDQIWDVGGKLIKVQVKHANCMGNGSFGVKCSSMVRRQGKRVVCRYTEDEIDGIATYFNNRVYYIPILNAPRIVKILRFDKPKSNIKSTVNWAEDYEVEKQLNIQSKLN